MTRDDLAELIESIGQDYGHELDSEFIWALVDEIDARVDLDADGDEDPFED